MSDLTIVIVNYNTADVALQAIGSALENTGGLDLEIRIIDNDSSDGNLETLRAAHPDLPVIAAGFNGGYAWGNNIGIAQAKGRHVLILNPDTVLHADTLKTAVAYMDAHPEAGILGARVFLEDGSEQSSVFREPSLRRLAWNIFIPNAIARKSWIFGDHRYASRRRDRVMDVDIVSGCFMLVPRRVIEEVGPMNDRFFMYSEESEWCWRVREAGYAVRYHPDVTITHIGAVSTGQCSPWKSVEIAKGQILFMRFTRGPFVARIATELMLAADLLRGLIYLPQMLIPARRDAVAGWRARTGFLLRALFRQPEGQTPPPPDLPAE
ncbi:glycosyltransferase family 2 protein [Maritimibacter sp. 55A14]|uniref:glycosyltransferase family 2 protein n=1 Tax=Maritimibacter sp. 55A14 TaxID=2174844 RepID=UPI001304C057|nr:glycosyltransferase family 2 protein [Maritimibacter sp. 55A14]